MELAVDDARDKVLKNVNKLNFHLFRVRVFQYYLDMEVEVDVALAVVLVVDDEPVDESDILV